MACLSDLLLAQRLALLLLSPCGHPAMALIAVCALHKPDRMAATRINTCSFQLELKTFVQISVRDSRAQASLRAPIHRNKDRLGCHGVARREAGSPQAARSSRPRHPDSALNGLGAAIPYTPLSQAQQAIGRHPDLALLPSAKDLMCLLGVSSSAL